MNKRIKILIMSSILGLLALSLIQGYLIKNTYQLNKDAFLDHTKREINKLDNYSTNIDSIHEIWEKYFIAILKQHREEQIKDNITKNSDLNNNIAVRQVFINKVIKKADSLNVIFKKLYRTEIKNKKIIYDVKIQKRISKIIINDSLFTDTIFMDTKNPLYLIGDKFNFKKAHAINTSLWMSNIDYNTVINNKTIERNFELEFGTINYMNIDGWRSIVFKRMLGVFAIAIALFLFVFGLLYYSIKNLIKQKKIADVKTDFVNNITHELKTPLATLTLATNMLRNDKVKTNERLLESTMQTIERQNKRLQKLIDQVLGNSLGYKEIKLIKEKVIITNYLNTILEDFSLSVKDKKVKLKKNFSNSNSTINIDKFYFTTAILNILENAVKYNNGIVNLEIKSIINENFILSIKDNGIGIPMNKQQNLFEKFYRVDNKDVHNTKGLGLGLYYANQIVKAHQGTIEVISEKTKGTEFVIKLPITKL